MTAPAVPLDPLMPASLPRRRVRTIVLGVLLLVLFAGVGVLGWIGWSKARPHLLASAVLSAQGADVYWSPTPGLLRGGATSVRLDPFRSILSYNREFDLSQLPNLHRVLDLDLQNYSKLTPSTFANVSRLPELEVLRLGTTYQRDVTPPLTDAHVAALRPLRRLRELDLQNADVTDAGLANLAGMADLQDLDLSGTQVTDAGLVHLMKLKKLRTVHLLRTRVTPAGIAALQQALPEADLMYDEPALPTRRR